MLCSWHVNYPCFDFNFDSAHSISESKRRVERAWLYHSRPRRDPRSNPIIITMASANRIRERYLHQLGLQRGVGGIPTTLQTLPQPQHVVVISGLPSLPEDRATTTTDHHGQQQHLLESHDFSIVSRLSHHTHENASSVDDGEEEISWSGDSGRCAGTTHSFHPSISPSRLTSMALPCPIALKNVPVPPSKPMPSPTAIAALSSSLPFTLSQWRNSSLSKSASVLLDSAEYDSSCSVGTCTTAESSLMLSRDWGAYPHPNPSSSSRAQQTISAAASISSSTQGESVSPVSSFTPGVYFQQQNTTTAATPPIIGSSSSFCSAQGQQLLVLSQTQPRRGGGGCATASSLAHALHRFNIDSDCEASLASNSIIEDHNAMTMEDNEDDTASRSSVSSYISAVTSSVGAGGGSSSTKSKHSSSHHHIHPKKNKAVSKKAHHHHPATGTSIDRATAHERILKVRSDHSMKMRANLAQSHRNKMAVAGNLSLIMAQGGISSSNSISSGMGGSTGYGDASSLPLEHHVHQGGSSSSSGRTRPKHPHPSSSSSSDRDDRVCCDLGRTPTASNCGSDLQKLKELGLVMIGGFDATAGGGGSNNESTLLPAGVHISQDRSCYPYPKGIRHQQEQHLSGSSSSWRGAAARPLQVHPELVYRAPNPPSKLGWMTFPQVEVASSISRTNATEQEVKSSVNGGASNDDSTSSSLHHTNHSIEDVMEVALTLSKLGGAGGSGGVARSGPIPRFR
jgi:hypothetical protein